MNGTVNVATGSLLCRWLVSLWNTLRATWHASAVGGWFHRRRTDLQRAGANSQVVDVVVRDGAMTKAWQSSLFGRLFVGLWNLPVRLLKGLYRALSGLWNGSLAFRGLAALGRSAAALVGLFTLWMLVSPHEAWNNIYGFLAAVAIFALYCVGCADRGRSLEVGRFGPYFAFYAVFITLGLVGSFSRSLSLRFFLFHLTCFLLAVVTVSAVREYRQLKTLLILAGIGLAAASLYGCYQGYIGVEVVASQQDMTLNKDMPGRIYSFFDNPNNFAEVLVMFFPLVGALTLNARGWRGRLCGLVALGLGAAAIGMTYSRSSWLGLALAAVIFLALMDWRFLPAMLVVGGCAIPFLPRSILNRILTIGNMKDSSARYRIAIYEDTARLLKDYGVTGVGLGSDVTRRVFLHYPTLYDGNYPIHTHNNYLQMWAEIGIFGLLAYLGLMVVQVRESLRAFRKADKQLRRILAAALGGLVGLLAIGLVEYTWFYPRNMFLFWILFAVIASAVKLIETEAGRAA